MSEPDENAWEVGYRKGVQTAVATLLARCCRYSADGNPCEDCKLTAQEIMELLKDDDEEGGDGL